MWLPGSVLTFLSLPFLLLLASEVTCHNMSTEVPSVLSLARLSLIKCGVTVSFSCPIIKASQHFRSGSFKLCVHLKWHLPFLMLPLSLGVSAKPGASGWVIPSALTFLSGPGVLTLGPGHYFCINDISIMHSIIKCSEHQKKMTRIFSKAFNIKGIDPSHLSLFNYKRIIKHIEELQTKVVSIWKTEM